MAQTAHTVADAWDALVGARERERRAVALLLDDPWFYRMGTPSPAPSTRRGCWWDPPDVGSLTDDECPCEACRCSR